MYRERQTYPSRKHLNYSNSTAIVNNQSETPQTRKQSLGSIAVICVGFSSAHCNNNEVIKRVKLLGSGFGTKHTPLAVKPITPLFNVKNRGCLGGGTSSEALRRAKRKARLKINHNHNGNR